MKHITITNDLADELSRLREIIHALGRAREALAARVDRLVFRCRELMMAADVKNPRRAAELDRRYKQEDRQ